MGFPITLEASQNYNEVASELNKCDLRLDASYALLSTFTIYDR